MAILTSAKSDAAFAAIAVPLWPILAIGTDARTGILKNIFQRNRTCAGKGCPSSMDAIDKFLERPLTATIVASGPRLGGAAALP